MLKKFLVYTLIASGALLAAAPEKVMHLAFDKAGDLNDKCGNAKVTAAKNAPKWDANGVAGGCLYFDGKSTLKIKKNPKLLFAPDQSFSLEICCRPEKTGEKDWGHVFRVSGGKKNWGVSVSGGIGRPMLQLNGSKKLRLISSYQNLLRKWFKVSIVRDAKSKRVALYLDGRKVKEGDDADPSLFSIQKGEITIGQGFKGNIDEIILWNGVKNDFTPAKRFEARIIPLPVDPDVANSWKVLKENKIDLVPAPKKIKITGKAFKFDPKEWKIQRSTKLDGPGIDVLTKRLEVNKLGKIGTSGSKVIYSGLYDDLKAELAALKAPAKPIRQGYVLIVTPGKIVIAGTDLHGLLYGWQTLADLVSEKGSIFPVVITDWPSFSKRRLETGVTQITGKNGQAIMDAFFRLRATYITLTGQEAMQRTKKYPAATWKKITDYLAARGMSLRVTDKTRLYTLGDDFKKLIPPGYSTHYFPYKTEEGLFGYFDGAYSWSRDDLAQKAAEKLADYLAATGISGVGFHSIDCGGFDNPGNWAKRTQMDKDRWGDDRVAAEVNLIKIFYKAIKAKNPNAAVSFCQYPYWCVDDPRMLKYYEDLAKKLPGDIGVTLREGPRKMFLDNAKRLAPLSVMTSIYPYDYSYLPSYTNSGRYAGSMYINPQGGTGFVHWNIATYFYGASDMGASEYMWNSNAPGAAELPNGKHAYQVVFDRCPEMEDELLPRACRRIYGTIAGNVVADVYKLKLCERIAEHPDNILPSSINKEQFFVKMVENASTSWKKLQAVEKHVSGAELLAFQELMRYVKRCELLATARLHCLRARAALNDGNVQKGKSEAALGNAILKKKEARNGRMATWKSIANDLNITEVIETRMRRAEYLKTIKSVPIRVGLYGYRGSEGFRDNNAGILDGFNNIAGITTTVIRIPTKANLKNIDVMVFNATKQIGDCEEDAVANLKEFVRNGGGIIFAHNAVGRHEGVFKPAWFPEICKGFDATGTNQPTLNVVKPVAVSGFLKAGDKYTHRYYDHCRVIPGKSGTVEIRDKSKKAVLVSGTVGKGRVVYTGEIFGLARSGKLVEPELEEWKMLHALFRWCAGKK